MAIPEIVAFVNDELDKSLRQHVKEMIDGLSVGIDNAFLNTFGASSLFKVKVYQFTEDMPLPITVETDEKRYAVLQQQIDGMHYVTRDDTLITTPQEDGQWLLTADTVRPFNGRIIYVEGEAVKVIQFTKDRGVPLFFSYKETGQNQWVGMPQLEELTENGYVSRGDAITLHANGDISIDTARPFDGRLILLGGA